MAIVCVGNNPNLDNGWKKISSPSEGREDLDRKTITLDEQEELIKQVFAANPKTIVVLKSSFPYAINWTQENLRAIVHMAQTSCLQRRSSRTKSAYAESFGGRSET